MQYDVAAPGRHDRSGWQAALYVGVLILAAGLGDPTGLVSVPILVVLKDNLHLGPQPVAIFESIVLVPHYLAFLFGALRDRWSPFGWRDRGYFLLAAPIGAGCYFLLANGTVGYTKLLALTILAMVAFQLLDTAAQALMTSIAQRDLMTGRLSAFTELVDAITLFGAAFIGGWMITHASLRAIFLTAGAITLVVFGLGFWKPKGVFGDASHSLTATRTPSHSIPLLRNRAILSTLAILMLYNFSPGWGTPLFYYLTEHLKFSPEAYGTCRAITFAGNAAATAAYGLLCVRHSLKRLLWWGVLLNIFPCVLFLLIQTPPQAIAVSGLLGLLAGFSNVALFDLLMRSSPQAREGTVTMLGVSALGVASAIGDIAGAWFYERSGFASCIAMDALGTLMIVPVLWCLPAGLISSKDGEPLATTLTGVQSSGEVA